MDRRPPALVTLKAFPCLFCNLKESVSIKIAKVKNGLDLWGKLGCWSCGVTFECPTHCKFPPSLKEIATTPRWLQLRSLVVVVAISVTLRVLWRGRRVELTRNRSRLTSRRLLLLGRCLRRRQPPHRNRQHRPSRQRIRALHRFLARVPCLPPRRSRGSTPRSSQPQCSSTSSPSQPRDRGPSSPRDRRRKGTARD